MKIEVATVAKILKCLDFKSFIKSSKLIEISTMVMWYLLYFLSWKQKESDIEEKGWAMSEIIDSQKKENKVFGQWIFP